MESNMEVSQKTKNPAIPQLGIYLQECAPAYYRATCTPMFIAALFIKIKLLKQLSSP
jgi:hypothetical protein